MREKNYKVILAAHNPYITVPLDTDEFSVKRWERSISSYQMEVNYFEMFAKWAALRLFA